MSDFQPSKAVQSLPNQYFSSLTATIADLKSRYDDVIDLAVGTPDLPAPKALKEALGAGKSGVPTDRKSTRLNSSHVSISYAVFCLKKKKNDIVSRHQTFQSYK